MAVIAAWSQISSNPRRDPAWAPRDPASLMAQVVRQMAAQRPAASAAMTTLGAICCIEPFSWSYEDLNDTVVRESGLPASCLRHWEPAGGNAPSEAIHHLACLVDSGEVRSALVVGAEVAAARAWARKTARRLDWPERPTGYDPLRGQAPFATPLESHHGITRPTQTFAMLDNSLRASVGAPMKEWRIAQAALLARNLQTALANPYAWNPVPLTVEEIAGPDEHNRMVAYPYSKRMMALPTVDQAAALLLLSNEEARRLGLDEFETPSLLGGASGQDSRQMIGRGSYERSAALKVVLGKVFDLSALHVNEIDGFDLYSCFPSAIRIARDTLQIAPDDPRPLTTTGGLAFAGGPGNSYCLHAFAAACDAMMGSGPKTVLVTGVGMSFAKHTATVISVDPGRIAGASGDIVHCNEVIPPDVPPPIVTASGGIVETYTIDYDRDGQARKAIAFIRTDEGRRTVANVEDALLLQRWTEDEPIGSRVRLDLAPDGRNLVRHCP